SDTAAKTPIAGMWPHTAAATRGTKLAACSDTQVITQRRLEPSQATPAGETSCRIAPARIGIDATSPAAISPIPSARTNAGKYVSPIPTITLKAAPSETLLRRFLRSTRRRVRNIERGGSK